MKVKATNKYKELSIQDNELGRILEEGEVFEVTKERFDVLNGNNQYKEVFVEEIKEIVETATVKAKSEKAVKKLVRKTK